jgi:hypothetical protein
MSFNSLRNQFDSISFNLNESFYIHKQNKIITNNEYSCCGFTNMIHNKKLYFLENLEKCKKQTNNLVCSDHRFYSFHINNKIKPKEILVYDYRWIRTDNDYEQIETDNKIKFNFEDDKLNTNFYEKKNKLKSFPNYKKLIIDFYPVGTSLIFKYFDINDKLIFKGIIYDNLQLTKTVKMLNELHTSKYKTFILSLVEGFYKINYNINYVMLLDNTPICQDVISEINNTCFEDSNIDFLNQKFHLYNEINYKLDPTQKIYFWLNIWKSVINDNKFLLSNERFKNVFLNKMKFTLDYIQKEKIDCDKDKLERYIYNIENL